MLNINASLTKMGRAYSTVWGEDLATKAAMFQAMGLAVLVGVVVSGLAGDAVSGIVAGVGAGGAMALRPEPGQGPRPRFLAVVVATLYTFVLVRTAPVLAIVPAPIFPLTALGLADNWHELTAVLRPARR